MSQFDPQAFLDSTTTEASIKRPPLPIGDYTALITKVEAREWVSKKADAKKTSGLAFDLTLQVEVPHSIREQINLDGPTLTLPYGVLVDTTPQGSIDYGVGKNGALRKVREATGLNEAGQPFSPRMFEGKVVLAKVGHREYQGDIYDEVTAIAKA